MIVALILFSSIMTAIITAIELYVDYNDDISGIEARFDFIGDSYLPTLTESVWVADDIQIQTQLAGLSRLQDIESISIAIDNKVRWHVGEVYSDRTIVRTIPILREYRGKRLDIGTLEIVASVDNVLSRLWDKLIAILISNAIKTMLVSIFMLLMFQIMVGRHLEHIAFYVRSLGKQPMKKTELVLERDEKGLWRPDALDYVTNAINEMCRDITESQSRIIELNSTLENRVEERTSQLEEANTQLSAALRDLEEVSKAKTLFLSRMSHELRTPLNAICGFSKLLQMDSLSADQKESVDWIAKSGDHLLHLINDLLDLSRIEVGKLVVEMGSFSLAPIIDEAIQMTQSQREYRGVTLENSCVDSPTVVIDPTRLTQILVNLLSNAIKYNRAGGAIYIGCETATGSKLRLTVTDTGYGIPAEKQSLVFTPFERLGAEHSGIEGTGIGLALSQNLAELMSLTLGFSSTPGEGSSFWVEMPISAEAVEFTQAKARKRVADGENFRVLYVEDNMANLKLIESIFKLHPGYSLLTAKDGMDGLRIARSEKPDVILLDIHLPLMDGYQVLAELKTDRALQAIPVIALTADALPADIRQGLEAGFYHYLTKPIDHQQLIDTVAGAVYGLD